MTRNEDGLAALGFDSQHPQDVTLLLGFGSLQHLDAALVLEREFRRSSPACR
jgi:hypothetical protein